jgi:outer membrane protein assembly factor BamB
MKVDNDGVGIYAFNLQGAYKWTALKEDGARLQVGLPFCSICQGAGNVYAAVRFVGGTGHSKGLFAVKQADGTDVWKLDGEWGGVSFDGRFVYSVKKDDGKLYCLKPADGTTQWSTPVGGPAQLPPGQGRGMCVVITDVGAVAAFPTDGANAGKSLAWQSSTAKPFTKDALVLSGVRMSGSAEVIDETHHTYRRAILAIAEGAGTNGVAIIANGSAIQALDLKTGGGVWASGWDEKTLGPAGCPNIAGGCLIVSGKNGVICFGPPK